MLKSATQLTATITDYEFIYLTNATTVNNKLDELTTTLDLHKVSVVAITETWEKSATNINLPGFSFFSCPRTTMTGGGVAIYIKNGLTAKSLSYRYKSGESPGFEMQWVYVRPKKLPCSVTGVAFCATYLPMETGIGEKVI